MSIVAEFAVPHAEFALAGTFAAVPELVLEAERVVAHPSTRRLSYFWAVGPTTDVEQELRMDPTTMRVSRCTTTDAGALYRIDWQPAITARIEAVLDPDITVLTLVGRETGWRIRLRVTEHETLSAFQQRLTDRDCSMTLTRLQTPNSPTLDGQVVLTAKQREALVAAYDNGYFEVPRRITLSALADRLDISQQALSKRLRRAQQALTEHALASGQKQESPQVR